MLTRREKSTPSTVTLHGHDMATIVTIINDLQNNCTHIFKQLRNYGVPPRRRRSLEWSDNGEFELDLPCPRVWSSRYIQPFPVPPLRFCLRIPKRCQGIVAFRCTAHVLETKHPRICQEERWCDTVCGGVNVQDPAVLNRRIPIEILRSARKTRTTLDSGRIERDFPASRVVNKTLLADVERVHGTLER